MMEKKPVTINPVPEEPLISSYLHNRAREMGIPLSGTFEITGRCNFNCKMCYVHNSMCNHQKSEEMSAEWWIETGRKAVDSGMVFLLITGGEPLLRDDFPEIYKALHEMGLVVSLNTNGYLLTDKIRKLFFEYPPNRINVSLYGSDNDAYEKFTGVRAFDTIIANINVMREAGIDVRFNCSITQDNCDDIKNIYKVASDLGLHIKSTSYMYPQTRLKGIYGENDSRLSPLEAARCRVDWSLMRYSQDDFVSRAKGMQMKIDEFLESPRECAEENGIRCRAGRSSFWLNKNGEMSVCGMFDKSFDVKTLGFTEAWNRVRTHAAEIRLPAECLTCPFRHICNVCAAVCYTETGDFGKVPEYVCAFSRETARLTQIELERLMKNK
ncbi:MAG: radical SAM protein [Clostridia bacterium]|nr:radical SAM protein [Clostridia bacterium]